MSKLSSKIILVCNGETVNKHSDGGIYYGWSNPLDTIPPIGSIIEYKTISKNNPKIQGILTKYIVKGYTFTTEEDSNHTYSNKVCKIAVDVLE